ncbi:MAG: hypothetical protein ACK4K7_08680 [Allosphingosinicella sp.]|uniref:hypothetical protein n=1 Tax=Allosphingosinicella sp. TaxID=2823234 RepID=UPI00394C7D8C
MTLPLRRWLVGRSFAFRGTADAPDGRIRGRPIVGARSVERMIAERCLRARSFPGRPLDWGWTLMLTLYHARLVGRRMTAGDLEEALPLTPERTRALIEDLCRGGQCMPIAPPSDPDRVFIALTHDTAARMADHFVEMETLLP